MYGGAFNRIEEQERDRGAGAGSTWTTDGPIFLNAVATGDSLIFTYISGSLMEVSIFGNELWKKEINYIL
jgi:hypothetical protein